MVQPLLLRPQDLRQLPALPDDRGARAEAPAWPCYRSEAFAEDLLGSDTLSLPARRLPVAMLVLLYATPLCAAVFGGAVALLRAG